MAGLASELSELWADVRAHPRAALVELGSFVVSVLLVLATIGAMARGPPSGRGGLWLAVVLVGVGFATYWTLVRPLADRFRAPSEREAEE